MTQRGAISGSGCLVDPDGARRGPPIPADVALAATLWHKARVSTRPASQIRRRRGQRCRSSVVEHSLGKGEVESSILSGSTIFHPKCRFAVTPTRFRIKSTRHPPAQNLPERSLFDPSAFPSGAACIRRISEMGPMGANGRKSHDFTSVDRRLGRRDRRCGNHSRLCRLRPGSDAACSALRCAFGSSN
jgi:hypothetical protein